HPLIMHASPHHSIFHLSLFSSSTLSLSLLFFFLLMLPPPPRSTLFPYTTLFRSERSFARHPLSVRCHIIAHTQIPSGEAFGRVRDRKSTRLNSSHLGISYAVFCLKKKKKKKKI